MSLLSSLNTSFCKRFKSSQSQHVGTPPNCFKSLKETAWNLLEDAVSGTSSSPARYVNFATVDPITNIPEARIVAIQNIKNDTSSIDFYADKTSAKMRSLKAQNSAAITVWDPSQFIQARLSVQVEILNNDLPEVREVWETLPSRIKLCYGSSPSPGSHIEHATSFEKKANFDDFAILRCHVLQMDLIYLDPIDRFNDRRALLVKNGDDWDGSWLAP